MEALRWFRFVLVPEMRQILQRTTFRATRREQMLGLVGLLVVAALVIGSSCCRPSYESPISSLYIRIPVIFIVGMWCVSQFVYKLMLVCGARSIPLGLATSMLFFLSFILVCVHHILAAFAGGTTSAVFAWQAVSVTAMIVMGSIDCASCVFGFAGIRREKLRDEIVPEDREEE